VENLIEMLAADRAREGGEKLVGGIGLEEGWANKNPSRTYLHSGCTLENGMEAVSV